MQVYFEYRNKLSDKYTRGKNFEWEFAGRFIKHVGIAKELHPVRRT